MLHWHSPATKSERTPFPTTTTLILPSCLLKIHSRSRRSWSWLHSSRYQDRSESDSPQSVAQKNWSLPQNSPAITLTRLSPTADNNLQNIRFSLTSSARHLSKSPKPLGLGDFDRRNFYNLYFSLSNCSNRYSIFPSFFIIFPENLKSVGLSATLCLNCRKQSARLIVICSIAFWVIRMAISF